MENILKTLLQESEITNLFNLATIDSNIINKRPMVAYRVKSNVYKIRAFELWGDSDDFFFRIYHSEKINAELKQELSSLTGVLKNNKRTIDYKTNDYKVLADSIREILNDKTIIQKCENDSSVSKMSKFNGLKLPDIDTSIEYNMGQTFSWRDIISIWEDDSKENLLKESLKRPGIYIQRSQDGKSRYIGSAYGEDGILGRWMKHLDSNGDARHLNLFVLENGYNEIVFSVIEFYDGEDIIKRESIWKQILGSINTGSYNAIQLNNN